MRFGIFLLKRIFKLKIKNSMSTITITAADVNKLRTITGAGMMDCKKALVESEGDFDLAIENLRKKGQKVAANRSDRESTEGAAIAVVNADKTSGVVITLNCETDFVGKNEGFVKLATDLATLALNFDTKEAFLAADFNGITVAEKLIEDGYNAAALHGDLSQAQRDGVMKSFRGRQIQMLVATDVAARGIDVENITHVINYQLPDEIETYTHRSGRTGRAGKSGTSFVIITKSEIRKIHSIERIIKTKFEEKPIPSGMEICEIQLLHLANKIKDTETDHSIDTYLPSIMELLQDIPKEDLIKKVISVEFNRFLNYYKKTKDLASQDGSSSRAEIPSDGSVRYFINIGSRDDYDWMTLKDYLRDTLAVGQDDVFKVDVKEGFSFFNTNADMAEKVMEVLNSVNINGRKINVEISKNEGGSGRRDHNGRSGGGRSGGSGFSGRREGGSSGGYRGNSGGGNREGGGYRGNSGGGNREGGGYRGNSGGDSRDGGNREGGSGFRPRTTSTGGSDRRSSSSDSRDSGRRGEGRSSSEGRSTERRSSGFDSAKRTPRRSND